MEKSREINSEFQWPCCECTFNNHTDKDYPCNICENNLGGNENDPNFKSYFEKILDQIIP